MSNKQQLQKNNETLATLVEQLANNPTATELLRAIETHVENTNNPHGVTCTQLGVADYIVEQGTLNGWSYRKWISGVAECWGDVSVSNLSLKQSNPNGAYYGQKDYNFPSGVFVADSPLRILLGLERNTYGSVATANVSSKSSSGVTVTFINNTGTSLSCDVNIYAIGKWK